MERDKRDLIVSQAKKVMSKSHGLNASEIHEKLSSEFNLFGDCEVEEFSPTEIEVALKDEASDPLGIISSPIKRGRRLYFTLKRERRARIGKPDTDTEDTKKIGTGGEHLVLSELLFRGYQANIMSVDDGIDIVASKDNKIFFIQVKTTYMQNNRISIQLPITSFERVRAHDVRYFFVIREGYGRAKILMLHQHDIITNANNGYIDKSDANYNIKIEFRTDGTPELYNNRGDKTRIPSATQEMHKFDL